MARSSAFWASCRGPCAISTLPDDSRWWGVPTLNGWLDLSGSEISEAGALALAEADLAEEEKATSLHEVQGTDTSDLLVEEAAEEKGKAGVVTTTPSKSPERPAVVGPIEPAPAEEETPNEATVPAAVQDRAPGEWF